ncbi:latent transforming growth factor beta binding protein 4 [Aphelenchoides avenae]|nr:latent transforming growth factor beta binding protein 4 [Aphelenchus avenae]
MTENQHFAGGNTDWEERKLGRFKTSETRFLEVMEYACKKNHLEDSSPFDPVKDLQFKCQALAEENEELLESWFFKRQDTQPDLFKFFCIEELRKCCAKDHWGPNCQPCPGAQKTAACFGRGECQGAGTRGGDGKCTCDKGYVGIRCSNCDAHYYAVSQNETSIECAECFEGCASGCIAAGPKGCRSCRSGYVMDEQDGCKDVDECEQEDRCTKSHEKCVNTAGSYYCSCEDGYRTGENDECEIDIEAHKSVDSDSKVADGTQQEADDSSTHSPEL